MRKYRLEIFFVALIVLCSAVFLGGAHIINRGADRCSKAGGVQVKTYGGFTCIKAAVIPESELKGEP